MPEQPSAVAKRQRSGKSKGLTSLNRTFQETNIGAFVDMGLRPIAPTKGLSERLRRPFGASPFGNLRAQILRFILEISVLSAWQSPVKHPIIFQ